MTIRPCSRTVFEDRVCFTCVEKCQNRLSIRGQLHLPCPKSLSIIAYATTIFEYFPRGINANQLEREIESNHHPSHLSKPTALQFLENLRKCISDTIEYHQDTTLLQGDVVVDETLWTHEELEGG